MAVSTVDEYLSALEKCKLLGSEQLVEAQRLAGASSDAEELAKALARDNLVSRWQAGTLLALGQRAQLRLGKYKLIQKLGKGGMGTVFLAEHVTMNRRVALKIVPRAIAEDRASLDRFFAEARAIAALDHPNIVQAYSVDNEMDRYFIVMEFVDGQDLQQMVTVNMAEGNGPLDFERAADFIRQAAEGLAHAHARNLVHCDIKPSNLLVNNQGVVKILDLGLARLNQSDDPRGAAAGEPAFGTVDYMAPEQAMGTANFDHRADIYSLGCTLYYLLTGHPPFPEGTIAQRLVKHQTQEPRDILLERPKTPPKLVEICKRMMAKEPQNRYQSIQEVSAALGPRPGGSSGATAVRPPLLVKPLEEPVPAVSGADDWLSVISASQSNGVLKNVKASSSAISAGKSSKSGKRLNSKVRSKSGIAAALGRLWEKLAWFNTTPRKIAGIAGGIAALAALAGLASLPVLLFNPKPAENGALQSKGEEKKGLLDDGAGPPSGKSSANKPDLSRELRDKNAPDWKNPKRTADKPQGKPPIKKPEVAATKPPPAATKPDVQPTPAEKKSPVQQPPQQQTLSPAGPVSFDGLAAAVDLPQPGKAGAGGISLGKLAFDSRQKVDLHLLGGDIVAKGNPAFDVQKEGEGATGGWSVQMTEKGRDAVTIAQVRQDQGECKFQWTADAREKASLVRFCELKFSSDGKTGFVALCAPKTVPPLLIDVDTGATRARLSRDSALPDASALRLQVLPLDQSIPTPEIKIVSPKAHAGRPARGKSFELVAGDTVPVRRHVVVVVKKDGTPHVNFSISFEARGKDVLLDMQSMCEIGNQRVPFKLESLREIAGQAAAFLMVNDAPQNKSRKASAELIEAWKTAKAQAKLLGDLAGQLDVGRKSSIPFRVYSVLGEASDGSAPKVVIFQSGPVENPKAAGAKKNTKGNKSKGRDAPNLDDLQVQ